MSKTYINGELVNSSTNYAAAIEYTSPNGNKITVQDGIDNLSNDLVKINNFIDNPSNFNMRYNILTDKVEIFYNNKWNEWRNGNMQKKWIYNLSEDFTEITGNWSLGSTISSTNSGIYFGTANAGVWTNGIYHANYIDVSGYKKLHIEHTVGLRYYINLIDIEGVSRLRTPNLDPSNAVEEVYDIPDINLPIRVYIYGKGQQYLTGLYFSLN